jgi:hypothetical protein
MLKCCSRSIKLASSDGPIGAVSNEATESPVESEVGEHTWGLDLCVLRYPYGVSLGRSYEAG